MNDEERLEIIRILGEVSNPELPRAANHPGRTADVLCKSCNGFFTWKGVELDRADCSFICRNCSLAKRRVTPMRTAARIAAMPVFWVGLMTLISLILYSLGMGNPSRADLARRDQRREWHRQKLPRLYLQQASRCHRRVEILDSLDKPRDEVRHWAVLAQKAYGEAADLWARTKAEPYLRLSEAYMAGKAGDARKALKTLERLSNEFPDDHPSRATYLFYRAEVAALAGEDKETIRRDFEAVIEATRERGVNLFKDLAELGGAGLTEHMAESQVRAMSHTELPAPILLRRAVLMLEARNIKSPLANTVRKELIRAGKWDDSEEPELFQSAED